MQPLQVAVVWGKSTYFPELFHHHRAGRERIFVTAHGKKMVDRRYENVAMVHGWRARTPSLRRIVDSQAKTLERLGNRISELELQLAKALNNSSNSSKSPSSDIVKPPKKQVDRRKKAKRDGPTLPRGS